VRDCDSQKDTAGLSLCIFDDLKLCHGETFPVGDG
jgi:hypothetical protein